MKAYQKEFNDWIKDGNVIQCNGYYSTQDAQYTNRLKNKKELYDYFVREFIS